MKKIESNNKVKNWYDKIVTKKTVKLDKNFNFHHILGQSMVISIGGTGSGKTNALMSFLSVKNNSFYKIMIFSGSTTDEPIYEYLREKIEDLELYNNIEDVPELNSFDDEDKDKEKLFVIDDFINLKKKEMVKLQEYLTAGRKFGFTCWLQAQNYVSVPKTIIRNINYFILFKLNDNSTINNIIRNHNIDDIDKETFKKLYQYSTAEKLNFFMIDLKGPKEKRLRHNFTEFLTV